MYILCASALDIGQVWIPVEEVSDFCKGLSWGVCFMNIGVGVGLGSVNMLGKYLFR